MTELGTAPSDEVLDQAAEWLDQGDGVALATVVRTWGSSPRPVGSQLAINADGRFVGSGGCIERRGDRCAGNHGMVNPVHFPLALQTTQPGKSVWLAAEK